MDCDRLISNPGQHFTGIEFGGGNFTVRLQPLIKPPCRGKGEPVGGINFSDHIGQLETDPLKLADLLAKLLAINSVLQGHIENPAGAANAHGRHRNPGCIEPGVHHLKTAINLTQNLVGGQAAIFEFQDHVVIAAMRHRPIARQDFKPGMATIHQKTGDPLFRAFRGLVFTRGNKDNDKIGMRRA